MGMPISSYTILRTLAFGGGRYESNHVNSVLAPFKVFAFILHDPEIHADFHNTLQKMFDRLDFLTGENFLFFALVDPPSAWLEHAKDRDYYRTINQWEAKELINPENAPKSQDPGLTTFALAASLEIPLTDLPCIIVTDELRSKYFYKLSTDSTKIVGQLAELGYIAARLQPGERLNIDRQKLLTTPLSDLPYKGGDQSSFGHGLAKTLSDVLSFLISSTSQDSWTRNTAKEQAASSLRELYSQLDRIKKIGGFDESDVELDNLSQQIVSGIALLNLDSVSQIKSIVPIDETLLEYESCLILRTALKVYDLLMNNKSVPGRDILGQVNDFSPGVICMSKVFERETNLSMVHWIRKQLGISLPDFYDKFQPGIDAKFDGKNFNLGNNSRWLPPGIGQSAKVLQDLAKKSLPEGWDEPSFELLMKKWAIIQEKRNGAAHDRVTDMQSMEAVKDALTNLAQDKCFDKFYEMKLTYSGRAHAS